MERIQQIKTLASAYAPEVTQLRRHLHQHPELSFAEHETQKFVRQALQQIGISKITTIANTGLVALIEGKNPSTKTIALRADMDALPIEEQNDVDAK